MIDEAAAAWPLPPATVQGQKENWGNGQRCDCSSSSSVLTAGGLAGESRERESGSNRRQLILTGGASAMGRKGKTQKHTAKELAGKAQAAKERKGAAGHGGKGMEQRKAAMAKACVLCPLCKAEQPHVAGMRNHYASKHAKETFDDDHWSTIYGAKRTEVKPSKEGAKKDATKPKKDKKKKNDLSMLDGY